MVRALGHPHWSELASHGRAHEAPSTVETLLPLHPHWWRTLASEATKERTLVGVKELIRILVLVTGVWRLGVPLT